MGETRRSGLARPSLLLFCCLGLLLAAGTAAAWAGPSSSAGRATAPVPLSATSAPLVTSGPLPIFPGWSAYHGDPLLDGRAASSSPQHPVLLWSMPLPLDTSTLPGPGSTNRPYQSSPVLFGSEVMITTNDVLYAFNATTGALEQSVDLLGRLGDGPYVATPLVTSTGEVAVAQDGGGNNAGVVDLATGTVPLVCGLNGNPIASSPAPMPQDLVLYADGSGNVNAVNLATNSCTGPGFNKVGGGPSYRASPAIVYVNNVRGWDAVLTDTGSKKIDIWPTPAGGASTTVTLTPAPVNLYGSVAVANITNGTQSLATGFLGEEVGVGSASYLWSVNLSSNAPYPSALQMPTGPGKDPGVEGTVAVVDQGGARADVFLGNDSGGLAGYQFSDAGRGAWTPLWGFNAGPGVQFLASPVYARGNIVDGATNGWIYDVNATTGALAWKMYLGAPMYASPAVSGGIVYAFTSAGGLDAISLAAPPVSLVPPAPSPAGSTSPVFVWAGAVNTTGADRGNLSGASVKLTTTGGTVLGPNPTPTNFTGWAEFNWTTPAGVTSSINCTLTASVSATGYAGASTFALAEVDPSSPPPPPVVPPLHALVSSGLSTVLLGGTTWIDVSASSSGGTPLGGAAVQLTLVGGGTLASTFGPTGANGTFWTTYLAPATLPASPGTLIEVNVSAPGYYSAQNATALEIVAPPTAPLPVLSVSVSPGTALSVAQGGTVAFQVSVTNGSSAIFPPVGGGTVSLVWNPSSSGAFSGSGPTTAAGVAYFNFTSSGSATGSVLALLQVSATGYVPASRALAIAIIPPSGSSAPPPPSLSVSPTFGSSSFVPGTSTTLVVTVLSHAQTISGAWVNATVVESGTAPTSLSPTTAVSSASGVVSFAVSWNGSPQQTVTLQIEASAPGYAPGWTNLTVTLQPPPSHSTPVSNGFPLSMLDLLLLALTLVFAVAFVAALTRRRDSEPEGGAAGASVDEEAPTPPPDILPPAQPGPPPDTGPSGVVPPHEFDEEIDQHETHEAATPTEEVDRPGPPEDATPIVSEGSEPASSAPSEPLTEAEAASAPVLLEDEEPGPSAQSETAAEGAQGATGGGPVHVEMERTLGKERPSVEESNPYGEQISPEDVNPNVRRIPKKLLQPAEMRISGDEKASDEDPGAADRERERQAQEDQRQKLVEKSRRIKRANRPRDPSRSE